MAADCKLDMDGKRYWSGGIETQGQCGGGVRPVEAEMETQHHSHSASTEACENNWNRGNIPRIHLECNMEDN